MKKVLFTLAAFVAMAALSGCNTIQGVGKDVQKVGQAVEGVGKK